MNRRLNPKPILNTIVELTKTDPHAVAPRPITPFVHAVTLIRRSDGRAEDDVGEINYYDIGLKFNCLENNIIEIRGSDELLKAGYFIPSPVVIHSDDMDYQDPVKIGLYKFRESDDLDLPFECLRLYIHHLKLPIFSFTGGEQERAPIPGKSKDRTIISSGKASRSHYA